MQHDFSPWQFTSGCRIFAGMLVPNRHSLLFGPYQAPALQRGDRADCQRPGPGPHRIISMVQGRAIKAEMIRKMMKQSQ